GAAAIAARAATEARSRRRMYVPQITGTNLRPRRRSLSRRRSAKPSPQRPFVHGRDVGRDHFPADIGKADPGLALPADQVVAADLELEIHGGEVAAQGQDLEPQAPLLDAGPRRARHAMGMDLVEAVAVLVQGVTDGVRALPESGVEHRDVLVDQ